MDLLYRGILGRGGKNMLLGWGTQRCLILMLKRMYWVVMHTYKPSTQEAEAGGSRVLGQLGLHIETLFQKYKKAKQSQGQAPVAHACNPSYSGGRDQEDQGSKPAWGTLSQKYLTQKGRVEWLKV
jgi:hypothetical protein